MSWTPEQDELAAKLWKVDGLSASQIAERMGGVSRSAVLGRLYRLGLAGQGASARQRASAPNRVRCERLPNHLPSAPRAISAEARPIMGEKLGENCRVATPEENACQNDVAFPTSLSAVNALTPATFPDTASHGKPWLTRTSRECTWIVAGSGADALCCAAPIHGRGWCLAHYKRGHQPSSPSKRASEPFQARAQARFA